MAAPSDSMIGMAAVQQSGVVLPDDLELEEAERRYAKAVLERCEGNQSRASRALNISRNKLARLLKGSD
jgi:DNA-binding NtrC family response regulator